MTLSSFENISNNVVGNLVADLLIFTAIVVLGKVTVFAGRWPLRTRLATGNAALTVIVTAALWLGAPALVTLFGFGAASTAFSFFVLKDISNVGIVNSFGSTSSGITPIESLKLVKRKLDFLGIGAKKLSDNSKQFAEAVRRCRESGGQIRLLLSDPNNPALSTLAKRIGRDPQSYPGRVRESIRQALHVKEREGEGILTVKLYDLPSDFAFPHFRLMFTDDRICIFSHILWNDAEGMDNPQLIIRSKKSEPEESLYTAYQRYFDDLWDAKESSEISSLDDPRLQA